MSSDSESTPDRARSASAEEIPALLHESDPQSLAALLENPRLDETHLCLLLERKDLPAELLESIARRKDWLRSYRIRRALAFNLHTPRLVAMRLARELYLMDLVQLSLQPTAAAELRRFAEEVVLSRLPQLPLGQKIMLARRASARVVGSLLSEGHPEIVAVALDNAFLTEAQVLRVLGHEALPERVVSAIASHRKWSHVYNVRLALLRHPKTPPDCVLPFLPDLTGRDLLELARSSVLPERLREPVQREIARRHASAAKGTQRSGP